MVCSLCNLEGFDNPKSSCALLQRSPCSGCLRLGDLDCKINEVKSHLEALLSSRKALLTKVNEEHDPIVRRLPLELTTYIFSLCNPFQPSMEVFSEAGDESDGVPGEQPVPFILGAVCRTWRTIVFSTPHLWNVVSMTLTEDGSPSKEGLLEQWLARSGNHPLFVRVWFIPLDMDNPPPPAAVRLLTAVFATLRPFLRRFKVLELSVPPISMSPLCDANPAASSVSALENIKVKIIGQPLLERVVFDLGFLPSPRNLSLSGLSWRNVMVDPSNVTQLTVSRCELTEILEIVHQVPQLQSFFLSGLTDHDIHHLPQPVIPVVHCGIQFLVVDTMGMDGNFFDFFSFPSLQDLFYALGGETFDSLASFLMRSKCSLKCLDIHDIDRADEEALFELLHLTPTLTRLRIHGFDIHDIFFTTFGSTARIDQDVGLDQHLLPNLVSLIYNGTRCFDWSSVPLLFPSAEMLERGGAFRRLIEVGVVVGMNGEEYIDKETVGRILFLRQTIEIAIVDNEGNDLILSSMKHHGMVGDEMDEDSQDDTAHEVVVF